MPDDAPAIRRGMIVRHNDRTCFGRHVAAGYAHVEPAYCHPESVPVAESPPVRMSLASTHSREYWPRGGGALLRVLPTMNPSSDCEWALIDAIQKAMERRWYWMCLDSPFGPPDDALHTAGFATGALMFERGDGIVR